MAKRKPKKVKSKKRTRADSTESRIAAIRRVASQKPLNPPPHVVLRKPGNPAGNTSGDRPFWDEIISSRARETWTLPDLVKAAQLARCLSDIERVQVAVNEQGDTIINTRGTKIVNPLHALLETLTRRSLGLSKALHIDATATQGRSNKTGEKTKAEKEAKEAVEATEEDDLIPGPELH